MLDKELPTSLVAGREFSQFCTILELIALPDIVVIIMYNESFYMKCMWVVLKYKT